MSFYDRERKEKIDLSSILEVERQNENWRI